MVKYEEGTYQKCSFRGGSNIYIKLIICWDDIFIPSTLQSYVLHCDSVLDRYEEQKF